MSSFNRYPGNVICEYFMTKGIQSMSRKMSPLVLLALAGLSLSGCGYNPGARAFSGGTIGAGAGAVIGTLAGIGPGAGAAIGGSLGAVAGAAISSSTLNLGKPLIGH